MRKRLTILRSSLAKTFATRRDRAIGIALALAVFALFVMVPVWSTPGNDVAFQLSLIKPATFAAMVLLSVTNATLISMHLFLRRAKATVATKEAVGGLALLGSSVLATLGCVSCYSSILSVFGLGGVIFFGTYGLSISAAIVAISLYAVWMTAKRIEGECSTGCSI